MDSLKLDTSCTALILVDLQRGIVGMPTSPYSGSFVVEKGASLAAAFRRVAYTAFSYVRRQASIRAQRRQGRPVGAVVCLEGVERPLEQALLPRCGCFHL